MKRLLPFLIFFALSSFNLVAKEIYSVMPIQPTVSKILNIDELDIISSHNVMLSDNQMWNLYLLKDKDSYKIIYYNTLQVGEFSLPGSYTKKDPPLLTFQQLNQIAGEELLVYSSSDMKLQAIYTFDNSLAILIYNSAYYNQFPLYINFDSFLKPYLHLNYQKSLPIKNPNNYKPYIKTNSLGYNEPLPLFPSLVNSSLFKNGDNAKTILSLQFSITHPITSGILTTLWELEDQNWQLCSYSYKEYSLYRN